MKLDHCGPKSSSKIFSNFLVLICLLQVSCGQVALRFSNVHPDTKNKTIIISSKIMGFDIPKELKDFNERDITVYITKKNDLINKRIVGGNAKISRVNIGNGITRFNIDISPEKWKVGDWSMIFFVSGKKVFEVPLRIRPDIILPTDY